MFGWFKKEATPQSEPGHPLIHQFLRPMAISSALSEAISDYAEAVQAGIVTSPAYQRKGDSVVGIWNDTRLEALRHLWGFGASDARLLADHRQQRKLLDIFFKKKLQYVFPHQPSGDPVHDTLQALFQVYMYLDEAGSAVGDKETNGLSRQRVEKTVFSDSEQKTKILWDEWIAFEQVDQGAGDLSSMPGTLIEILYEDVTKKAKTIALSAQFGPDYRDGMNMIVKYIQDHIKGEGLSEESINKKLEQVRSTMKMTLEADDPDHLFKRVGELTE